MVRTRVGVVLSALLLLLAGCDQLKERIREFAGTPAPADLAAQPEPAAAQKPPPAGEKVALVLAHEGFEDREYEAVREAVEAAGWPVEVLSFFGGTAVGAMGDETKVDVILGDAVETVEAYAAVVLIGGPGAAFYHDEAQAHKLVQEALAADRVVAAICLAPYTLANAGVLEGRKATAWTGGKFAPEMLSSRGALFRDEAVVVDGRVITGRNPDAAAAFAAAIVETLGPKP